MAGLLLSIKNNYVKIHGDLPDHIDRVLDMKMRYQPEGVEWSDAVVNRQWDGVVHLYRNRRFPVGFLLTVERILTKNGIQYSIGDARPEEVPSPIPWKGFKPYDYQEAIIQEAMMMKNCLIPVATGGGKTLIAASIIARLGQPKALYLVPSIEILYQTVESLRTSLNTVIGYIGDNSVETTPEDRITVATWQSINSMISGKSKKIVLDLEKYNVLVVDEVHHYSADALYKVGMAIPARYRYGMSGTMFRTDGAEMKFFGVIGDSLKGISASELIDMGYLVPPRITFIRARRVDVENKTWRNIYKEAVVQNAERNGVIVNEAINLVKEGRRTLILVTEIDHGETLKMILEEMDDQYSFEFVHSQAKERPYLVEGFRKGYVQILISTSLFDEGVDLPALGGIILAGAGKSQVKAVQRVGRGLRRHPGKKDVVIIDFNDQSKYLRAHSKQRFMMYKKESRFDIKGDVPK